MILTCTVPALNRAHGTLWISESYRSARWTAWNRARLQAVLTRIGRLGYLPEDAPSIEQICSKADKALFASVCHNSDHVLSHLLPPKKESMHALRPRVHDRVLPEADDRMRRTFLTRMLYSDYLCLWTYVTLYVLYNDVCNAECGLQLWNKVDTYLLTYSHGVYILTRSGRVNGGAQSSKEWRHWLSGSMWLVPAAVERKSV